jgi:hypothetical protein
MEEESSTKGRMSFIADEARSTLILQRDSRAVLKREEASAGIDSGPFDSARRLRRLATV